MEQTDKMKFLLDPNLIRGVIPGPKETQYHSCEVLMILEKSTRGLLTIFNELEGEQKEFSKCEETSVINMRN